MNIKFQRAVDRYAGIPLCWVLSQFERIRGFFVAPRAPSTPQRILVILLSEMGSLVLAHPMFAKLQKQYPGAELHVMLFAKNREVLDLLGVNPAAHVLAIDDRSLGGFIRDAVRVIAAMRRLKFDAVVDCELFSRVSSIFSYLSGAAVRVGFHPHTQEGLYRGSFINRPVLYNPYRHLSHQLLTLVAAVSSCTVPTAKIPHATELIHPPKLVLPADEVAHVRAELLRDFPAITDKKLVLVYPSGGILPIRAWPLESYHSLCASLLSEGYAVGVIGLPQDRALAQTLVQRCASEQCVNLAGYTRSVRHLLTVFQHAALLITNDGGPGQFAAMTDIPALVLFGPETPALYSPLASNIHCMYAAYSCSPCLTAYNHRASPCDGDNQCLKTITPEQVLARAREVLSACAMSGAA